MTMTSDQLFEKVIELHAALETFEDRHVAMGTAVEDTFSTAINALHDVSEVLINWEDDQ